MDSQSRQSRNTDPVADSVFFLVHRLREEINAQVRRLLSMKGIDVEELERDLENGTNSDTVQRARELVASFSGDPYALVLRVKSSGDTVKIEAGPRHYFPIDFLTLKVGKECARCGSTNGDSICPDA